MFKKLMILSFGLALMLVWITPAAFAEKRLPTAIGEDPIPFEPSVSGSKAPCYWQWYYCNVYYFWDVPNQTWGDEAYAQRFSVACAETLMGVNVYVYDNGDGEFGDDDIYITAYDDDGTGLPGLMRGQITLAAGTYPAYPTPAYADFSTLGLVFNDDFHIAFSTSGANPGGWENCLSDDATCGQLRSTDQWPDGTWHYMATDWGSDVNFVFDVYMCTDWQWSPGDEHKMHYAQLPDEVGWDVNATYPYVLADDWQCSETGWIKDIHFWGSWKNDNEGIIDSFVLSFHYDIPAGAPGPYGGAYADGDANHDGIPLTVADLVHLDRILAGYLPPIPFDYHVDMNGDCVIDMADAQLIADYFASGYSVFDPYGGYPVPTCGKAELYSRPGEIIDTMTIKWYGVTQMSPSDQGWFDPLDDDYIENNHWDWYQYDICLPESNWVWQDQDSIYWLNISAFVNNEDVADTAVWGWKSSYLHFNDDAVWAWSEDIPWQELYEPPFFDYIPGDIDDDGDVDTADVIYYQNWQTAGGPPPPYEVGGFYPAADVNGDCVISLADMVYMVAYIYSGGPPPTYCYLYPPLCNYGTFGAEFDSLGNLINGWGSAFFGEGWYYYDLYGWWNMWWYDHPYDITRKKTIHYEVDFIPVVGPTQDSGYVEFAVNWSTDLWDDETSPPMPSADEDMYIGRKILFAGYVAESTHVVFDYTIPDYNPIWASVDLMAEDVIVEGSIEHCCVKSMDMSFVITGEPPDTTPPPPPHEGDIIFHNINGFKPLDGDPMGTNWHELWPNFCQRWDLTSWFDNGDGILSVCDYVDFTNINTTEWRKFHVEWIGPTLELEWEADTFFVEYICHDYPLVDTIYNPIGTWWHEVHPNYCETWGITGWDDNGNGYLDYCDWLYVQNYNSGEIRYVHVAAVQTDIIMNEITPTPPDPLPEGTIYHNDDEVDVNLYDPLGSWWHELYPTYCEMWELTSWFDNGDELLSVCDYVDFTSPDGAAWKKFHVDWIGWTIEIEKVSDPTYPIYLEMYGDGLIPLDVIIGTYWHEVYPNFCTNHFCVDWIDNGSGVLDSCDYLILQNMDTGEFDEYHVTGVKIDVILDEINPVPPEPLPEGINLHNPQGWRPAAGSPLDTYWHELHPNYCNDWMLTSWIDNGDEKLSVCDTLDFDYNSDTLYHVDWVGPTIIVKRLPTEPPIYLDYAGFDNPDNAPMNNVVGTYWHEVYPVYCPYWYVVEWIDNGSGYLDSCDYLIIQNLDDGSFDTYHVVEVQTDMIISVVEGCDCEPGNVNADAVINIFDITYIIQYLYLSGPAPTPYPLCNCDMNCDCTCNIFDVTGLISYLYMEGTPPCTCQDWLNACGPPLRK